MSERPTHCTCGCKLMPLRLPDRPHPHLCSKCYARTPERNARTLRQQRRMARRRERDAAIRVCTSCDKPFGVKTRTLRLDVCSKCFVYTPEGKAVIAERDRIARCGTAQRVVSVRRVCSCGRKFAPRSRTERLDLCSLCFKRCPEGLALASKRERELRVEMRQRYGVQKRPLTPVERRAVERLHLQPDCRSCRLWCPLGGCTMGFPEYARMKVRAGHRCATFLNLNKPVPQPRRDDRTDPPSPGVPVRPSDRSQAAGGVAPSGGDRFPQPQLPAGDFRLPAGGGGNRPVVPPAGLACN